LDKVVDKHWFWDLSWNSLLPVLIAVVGYAIVHILSAKRDSRNKKREIRAKFLTESYQKLARIVSSPEKWDFNDLQQVLIDIQLMGSNSQIDKAEKVAQRFHVAYRNSEDSLVDLEPLLLDIRDDLRKELSMKEADNSLVWLKVDTGQKNDKV